jgi:hypothetical protein
MSAELVFSLANLVALGSWILLAALPRVRWVAETLTTIVVPAALACLYIALLLARWNSPGGFSSLTDVATLFSDPWLLLAGWVHYLAFDLLIGSWEVRDAHQHNVPHLAVLPCLVLTFAFGPAGWLLYMAVRRAVISKWAHPATASTTAGWRCRGSSRIPRRRSPL